MTIKTTIMILAIFLLLFAPMALIIFDVRASESHGSELLLILSFASLTASIHLDLSQEFEQSRKVSFPRVSLEPKIKELEKPNHRSIHDDWTPPW